MVGPHSPMTPQQRSRRVVPAAGIAVLLVLAAFVAAYVFGVVPRQRALEALSRETRALAVPTVAVIQPKAGDAASTLVLPGNLQARSETAIQARARGYLRRWTVDIGAMVKAGDLLAEIDAPELDAELRQARATAAAAQAHFEQARTTSTRWQELVRTGSVSAQDADLARNALRAREADLEAARQNVARLERVQAYLQVRAPFAGVITSRSAETGELVEAGGGGAPGRELFRLAATDRLRVQVNVPQALALQVQPGVAAELVLTESPGRSFSGKVVRTARSIDNATRTLLAEIDVDNSAGELLPGAYAQVRLRIPAAEQVLVLPVNTLLFRAEGPQVAVVGADDRVSLRSVTIGRDFGTTVELLRGVSASDRVVINPPDAIDAGTRVRVVRSDQKAPRPAP